MSYRLVLDPAAESDLVSAQQWYEMQSVGLGQEFQQTIDSVMRQLAESPQRYPAVHRGVRRAVVRRFPYVVYFLLQTDSVRVLACLHGRRHPGVVRERRG